MTNARDDMAWHKLILLGVCTGCFPLAYAVESVPAPAATTDSTSAFEQRLAEERKSHASLFALTPHKPNYLLLSNVAGAYEVEGHLQPWEIKFQFSFKVDLVDNLLGGNLLFGYTQQSNWQMFNKTISSPFRETNYEPEIMWQLVIPRIEQYLYNRALIVGFTHQSNGRPQPLSRSWNRVYANFLFEYEKFYFSFKPWYRVPETTKAYPLDPNGDDNPNIDQYLGSFELTAMWARRDGKRLGLMLRNNLNFKGNNRGALQIDYSFPIESKLQGYVQIFDGYGESLIDYDHVTRRIGIGVMLNNWL
jgi:phospholipase A1/A2